MYQQIAADDNLIKFPLQIGFITFQRTNFVRCLRSVILISQTNVQVVSIDCYWRSVHVKFLTASIKPRLLFSRAGYASWGLSLSSVFYTLSHSFTFSNKNTRFIMYFVCALVFTALPNYRRQDSTDGRIGFCGFRCCFHLYALP